MNAELKIKSGPKISLAKNIFYFRTLRGCSQARISASDLAAIAEILEISFFVLIKIFTNIILNTRGEKTSRP